DVNVHAENQERASKLLQLFDDVLIALAGRDDLIDPARKRMRARGSYLESGAFGGGDKLSAGAVHFDAQLADVFADARAGLDDGLMHLVLDLIEDVRRRSRNELHDVRAQFARSRINDLKFLFDAYGETVSHGLALRSLGVCGTD